MVKRPQNIVLSKTTKFDSHKNGDAQHRRKSMQAKPYIGQFRNVLAIIIDIAHSGPECAYFGKCAFISTILQSIFWQQYGIQSEILDI